MNYKPLEANKQLASELAALIYKGQLNKDEITSYLQQLHFRSNDIDSKKNLSRQSNLETGRTIGIWEEQIIDGERRFIRNPKFADQFVYWSATHEIKPKSGKFRVVLLGESAARGFLIDPSYNPAMALEKIMGQTDLDIEVIDLARTNCSIAELETLAVGCMQLEPDALVIFAGNNWIINSQHLIKEEGLQDIINDINNGITTTVKDRIENKLTGLINNLFNKLEAVTTVPQTPVFFINPEFNLKDWLSNDIERLPQFSTVKLNDWYLLLSEAHIAIDNREYTDAEKICMKIIELYPFNPTGYEMMAGICEARQDLDNAYNYYQKAHDTTVFQTTHCPGVTMHIQEIIRRQTVRPNFYLIDLPLLFRKYLHNHTPNKELFLDYCHLTIDGINIVMYHVAAEILLMEMGIEMPLGPADVKNMGPGNKARSVSHFLAAIHNAHWGQPTEIIYYHCSRALSLFDLSKEMTNFVFTASSLCPWRLNKHFESLIEDAALSDYLLLAQPEEGLESFDLSLTNALLKALKEKGIDLQDQITTLRVNEHVFDNKRIDLLKSYYWLDYNYNADLRLKKSSFYTEVNRYSKFYLPGSGWHGWSIELVHRVPYFSQHPGIIEFEMNGQKFHSCATPNKWSLEMIDIPRELCIDGINTLVIYWPLENVSINDDLQDYPDTNLLHKLMYPVVGEIHSLTAMAQMAENVSATRSKQRVIESNVL